MKAVIHIFSTDLALSKSEHEVVVLM